MGFPLSSFRWPTVQTLNASDPHTAKRFEEVPVACVTHLTPSHFTTVPRSPTAQTLRASAPHTAAKSAPHESFSFDQPLTVDRRIVLP